MFLFLQEVVIENIDSTPIKDFFYNDYIVEIFGGLMLSMMGLFLIWFLRPKVKIAPKMALNSKGEINLKIINKSYLFQLVDIHFELTMLKPISTPKGMNIAIKYVELRANHVWFLSRRNFRTKKNDFATYAIVLTVKPEFDLLKEWKNHDDGTYFDLKVVAKNNFSGITSINHEKFSHYSSVKKGEYCHGNSFNIENGE